MEVERKRKRDHYLKEHVITVPRGCTFQTKREEGASGNTTYTVRVFQEEDPSNSAAGKVDKLQRALKRFRAIRIQNGQHETERFDDVFEAARPELTRFFEISTDATPAPALLLCPARCELFSLSQCIVFSSYSYHMQV
jgi:hypothetical protein